MKDLANNHPELSFEQVLTMVKKTLPNDYVPLMNIYALHVKRLRHVQDAFEYAHLFGQAETLDKLLEIHKTDDLLAEWVKVYTLFSSSLRNKLTPENYIIQLKNLFCLISNEQLRMKAEIAQLNYYDQIGNISNMGQMIEQFRNQFSNMESGFLKSALASRITLLAGNASLFGAGNYEEAERYYLAARVIDSIPDALLATAYHGLGHVYLLNDKDGSIEAHKKAILHAKLAQRTDYLKRLETDYFPYARNMLGETFDIENVAEHEQAHQYIVRGQNNRALKIINNLESKGKNSVHLLFYKAKALKSVPMLFKSIREFSAHGYTNMIIFVEKEINKLV